ncbi:fimbrial protein [Erwinia sp. CPCC 100877]|nr:fimbrial protein [Erwinia sp. CPCC 100877]
MKKKYSKSTHCRVVLPLVALFMLPGAAYAEAPTPVTVDGGTINFEGSVVAAACALSSNSADMTVDMGQVRTTVLSAAGSVAPTGKDFSILLEDCDASAYTGVSITFNGNADSTDPTALATGVNGSTSSAQNVAIHLFDEAGAAVKLNEPSSVTPLRTGSNQINFSAKYASPHGGATAGDASAVATYTLTYS